MNKSFIKKMRAQLLEQKNSLLKMSTQDVAVDTDGDETDEVQANQLIEMNNQLNIRNAAKIFQIDSAIKRIDEGTYGLCQDCEEPIPEKRLMTNPHFQTCVSCAEERETQEKQRKKF